MRKIFICCIFVLIIISNVVYAVDIEKDNNNLESNISENFYENKKVEPTNDKVQLSMDFEEVKKESEIENKVKEIDPLNMTPIDAINFLYELKEISKKSV